MKLRNWLATDAGDLSIIANHKEVAAMLRDNFPYPFSIHHATDFIRRCIKNSNKNILNAILYKEKLVGAISIEIKEDVSPNNGELGYWITPQYWGQGIASASVSKMVQLGFNEFKINRIYAEVFSNNLASIKVLEKCNFQKEDKIKNAVFKNGQFQDCYIFAIQNQQYYSSFNHK